MPRGMRWLGPPGSEIQFPEPAEVPALARESESHDLPITLINVPRGTGDEVGLAALPGREQDFRAAMDVCAEQARTLRAAKTNILSGRPPAGADRDSCMACLTDNLRRAGDLFGAIGVKVMVEPVNPMLGLYAAVTRQDLDGQPPGGWLPDQKLGLAEALHGFTLGAARASFDEARVGSLEVGKQADFVVLDRDPFAVDAVDLPTLQVLQTWVGGERVFERR